MTTKSKPIETPLRRIVKRSERQPGGLFDVLVCKHAVAVTPDVRANTFRRFRRCVACRERTERVVREGEAAVFLDEVLGRPAGAA